MMRTTIPVLAVLLLGACNANDPTGDVASDPQATITPTESPTPTAEPRVGTYPAFAHDDYTFTVTVSCFCADAGDPIRITVTDGRPTAAEWAEPGHQGEVPDYRAELTMADVIDATNNTEADQVTVEWPAGQEYPDSVWVDQSQNMADEEIGYAVTDVAVR